MTEIRKFNSNLIPLGHIRVSKSYLEIIRQTTINIVRKKIGSLFRILLIILSSIDIIINVTRQQGQGCVKLRTLFPLVISNFISSFMPNVSYEIIPTFLAIPSLPTSLTPARVSVSHWRWHALRTLSAFVSSTGIGNYRARSYHYDVCSTKKYSNKFPSFFTLLHNFQYFHTHSNY